MAADLDDNNSHSNSLTINGNNNGESINDTNEEDNANEDNGNNDAEDMEVGVTNYAGEEDEAEEEPDDGDEDEHDAMDEDDEDDERDIDENIDSIKESKRKTLNGDLVAEDLSSRSLTKINDSTTNKNVSKLSSGAILETGFHSKSPPYSSRSSSANAGQQPIPVAGQKASTPNSTNSGMAKGGRSKFALF